jgi:hypothetical protein
MSRIKDQGRDTARQQHRRLCGAAGATSGRRRCCSVRGQGSAAVLTTRRRFNNPCACHPFLDRESDYFGQICGLTDDTSHGDLSWLTTPAPALTRGSDRHGRSPRGLNLSTNPGAPSRAAAGEACPVGLASGSVKSEALNGTPRARWPRGIAMRRWARICGCVPAKRTQRDRNADKPEVQRAALDGSPNGSASELLPCCLT